MARQTDQSAPSDSQSKTGFGPQAPLQVADRHRVQMPERAPVKPGQIYTDWALI